MFISPYVRGMKSYTPKEKKTPSSCKTQPEPRKLSITMPCHGTLPGVPYLLLFFLM
jgi:hypothetical protein